MDWMDQIGLEPQETDYIESLNVHDPETEWMQKRLGKVTGSILGKLVKKDGKGYKLSNSKVSSDLLYKIAWERFLITEGDGLNRLKVSSQATNHGLDYELAGIKRFEEETGLSVNLGGHNFISKGDFFGGTPDGLIGDDAIIEIKAPWNGGNHLKTLLTGEIYNDEHFYQIQGYLYLTGRKKAYYCTYDPDMPKGLDISINVFKRDEEVISAIEEIVEECRKIVVSLIEAASKKL